MGPRDLLSQRCDVLVPLQQSPLTGVCQDVLEIWGYLAGMAFWQDSDAL